MERRKQLQKYIQRAKTSLTFEKKAFLLHSTACFWHCFLVLPSSLSLGYLSGRITVKRHWLSF